MTDCIFTKSIPNDRQIESSADTEIHYEWELQDANGDWVAGGDSDFLLYLEKEARHYYAVYSQDGPHKLIIRERQTKIIEE